MKKFEPGDVLTLSRHEVYIYELFESDTGIVRYVGQTVDPEGRLKHHRRPDRWSAKTNYEWVVSCRERGARADMRIITVVEPQHGDAAEALAWSDRQYLGTVVNRMPGIGERLEKTW